MVGPGRYGREGTFRDRHEAGRLLGERLAELRSERPVVLALPRGGVPVAAEVARALDAPLDVIVVRKLGVPFQPEVGFGAIGEGGVRLFDADLIRRARITEREVAEVEARERAELERRVRLYRGDRPPLPDAIVTKREQDAEHRQDHEVGGHPQVVRAQGASRIVLAVPVAPPETVRQLQDEADQVVSLLTPPRFVAVGVWYDDFEQTSDEEVAALLRDGDGLRSPDSAGRGTERDVVIRLDGAVLQGHLDIPVEAEGIVLFAHGSGSSRHSPRNQAMAGAFHTAGLATLLFDLLTPEESDDRRNVFDIELLGDRLLAATEWVRAQPDSTALARGYFGASTGGGAALWAAGAPDNDVRAVVSRGGRPDLAGPRLADVRCPTLLIVGGADREVLELNRSAASELRCGHRLAVVPGATHLFEEPGALETVARLAIGWFGQHLAAVQPGVAPGGSRPGEG